MTDVLAWAESQDFAVSGNAGDPNTAFGAIEDALRLVGADEIIICTYVPGRSNWLESGIVSRLKEELDIPVTHLLVDGGHAAATA
ncbi:hypothetical protein FSW04_13960 [Baekduia soli]|uniref:Uncharacterized protein n=1 Tax=Baekduia soli TaxID=496014 RepID=A0A5B8U647_9ACTN|nr:hypothetical protein [Baekduia soli]QEC48564.1 hypothetical protein FSW04_13960 [Baekduia soli]